MNRKDFPMLKNNIIYFDNAATTLKPKCMIEATTEYYSEYSANAHRGDYDISLKVDTIYENTREKVRDLINAKSTKEIIFTSGTTDSINRVVFGYFKNNLKEGDEVLMTLSEHASCAIPWYELVKDMNLKISYAKLNDNYELTFENLINAITDKTKVISLAHISNVVGDVRDIKKICEYASKHNIKVVVDGAQSVAHTKVDVRDLNVDFLAFSAHKMLGPTGVGILYGKEELLNKMRPSLFGGGMNANFYKDGQVEYSELPSKHEAGTQNIAGIIGFNAVIDYLNNIGFDKIYKHELALKKYAVDKLEKNPKIKIYNKNSKSGIISFNYEGVFPQDVAVYLNKHNICVRAGNHCAKNLVNEFKIKNTCRISFYLYNTYEEVDKLIEVLNNENLLRDAI